MKRIATSCILLLCLVAGCEQPDRPSRTLPPAVLAIAPATAPASTQPTFETAMDAVRAVRAALPARATVRGGGTMPDPVQTPGAVFTDVTTATVCVSGYPKTVRNVPLAVRKQVFVNYGIDYAEHAKYEVDHLISLELGGSNDITNLWPEPCDGPWNAPMKDQLENTRHRMVCAGQITMAEAQQQIAADSVTVYKKCVSP